jgi:FkbM family methyltransferase
MQTLSRTLKDLRYHLFYGALMRRGYELQTLGDPAGICQWKICPTGLNPQSIVYSAGVGSDITFEHDLVRQFGCQVILIDPSPTGVQTMSRPENQIPNFHFFPVALAGTCGKLKMAAPKPGEDAWRPSNDQTAAMEVSCENLETLMNRNRHTQIDLLKLDIEGSEYEVIEDLLKSRTRVHQICVEYHHEILPGIRRSQTISSIFKLLHHRYRLVDRTGFNHTFILRSWPFKSN